MKGLLIKDWLVIWRQMKIYLVFIAVAALAPTKGGTAAFAIMYGAIIPYSTMAFDERAKWDELAAMMPYTAREIVFSKYLQGYAMCLAASALSFIAGILYGGMGAGEALMTYGTLLCVGMLFIALIMPVMFRFGVEKGRLIYVACVAFTTVLLVSGASALDKARFVEASVFVAAAALALNALSIFLSVRFRARRAR